MQPREHTRDLARPPARRRVAWSLAAGAALALAAGCGAGGGNDAPASRPPNGATMRPPSSAGAPAAVCSPDSGTKHLPARARVTIERFVAAVARGDDAAARRLLAPSTADAVLAGLAPVTRLRLLALEDRY